MRTSSSLVSSATAVLIALSGTDAFAHGAVTAPLAEDGTTLMPENTTPFVYIYGPGTSTDFFSGPADFQPYSGGNELIGSLGSIPGGTGTLFTVAQLEAAVPGLNLSNSGQRATLTIIGTGVNSKIAASAILVNPGGVVTAVP